jgi:hypothetical protein
VGIVGTVVDVNASRLLREISKVLGGRTRAHILSGGSILNVLSKRDVVAAKTGSSETSITFAVVTSRVVLAGCVVVADVDTHGALVPVGGAGSSSPASNASAGEAKGSAVNAGTAMGTWLSVGTVINVLANLGGLRSTGSANSGHVPPEVADALVASSGVYAVRVRVAPVLTLALVDINFAS